MIQEIHKLIDSLLKLLSNLPPLGPSYYLRILLSLALVGISIFTLIKSKREGYKIMDASIARLKGYIRSRSAQPELLTADSLRTLAKTIQNQMHSPPLTDGAIAEAIRSVALEFEDIYAGSILKRRLEALNKALKELDPHGGSLLCLAIVDRMLAYFLIARFQLRRVMRLQIATEAAVLVTCTLAWASIPARSFIPYMLSLLWLYPAIYIYHILIAGRAFWYWRNALTKTTQDITEEMPKRKSMFITNLSPILDRFAYPIYSTNKFLALEWAPKVEQSLIFWKEFVAAHQYKYLEVRNLQSRLNQLSTYIPLITSNLISAESSKEAAACTQICRRLWLLTGHDEYLRVVRAAHPEKISPEL